MDTENDVVWWDTEDKGGRENDLARTNRRGSDTYDRHSI